MDRLTDSQSSVTVLLTEDDLRLVQVRASAAAEFPDALLPWGVEDVGDDIGGPRYEIELSTSSVGAEMTEELALRLLLAQIEHTAEAVARRLVRGPLPEGC